MRVSAIPRLVELMLWSVALYLLFGYRSSSTTDIEAEIERQIWEFVAILCGMAIVGGCVLWRLFRLFRYLWG